MPPAGESFWEAFHRLSAARTTGGGMHPMPNPIAYSEVSQYARDHGLAVDETWDVVQRLDAVWRMHAMTHTKKRMAKSRSTKGARR